MEITATSRLPKATGAAKTPTPCLGTRSDAVPLPLRVRVFRAPEDQPVVCFPSLKGDVSRLV